MKLPVAILAGGKATRLYPLTINQPKSMVLIREKPFIEWQLLLLKKSGVEKVVLCLGHQAESIFDYVSKNLKYIDLDISFSVESQPLGTAGALLNAKQSLGENFGVIYGDSYLQIEYLEINDFFMLKQPLGLMTVCKKCGETFSCNTEFTDGKVMNYSKTDPTLQMKHIDFGYSVFNRKALDFVEPNSFVDLEQLNAELIIHSQLLGFEVEVEYHEIGSHSGILKLKKLAEEWCNGI